MNEYIEVIGQIKPKNNTQFAIADVNDLKGGYIQVDTISEMDSFLSTNKLKEGMLCYVKIVTNEIHMYQFTSGTWKAWSGGGGGSGGGMSLIVVNYLSNLTAPELQIKGQLVFVNEVNSLRFFNGTTWDSFSKIYIQNSPPSDKGGIWIDTAEDHSFLNSNQVIQNLLQVVSILQTKIKKLEWAFGSQMDFGGFTNNKYYEYDGQPSIEPTYGTDEITDVATQANNIAAGVITDIEPVDTKSLLPNGTHLCIKSGTFAEMQINKNDFLPKELLWCWDKQQLWIKDPRTLKLLQIGASGGVVPIDDQTMEQILTEVIGIGSAAKTKITGIEFADMNDKNNTFLVQVINGKLEVKDYKLDQNTLAGNAQTAGTGIYYTTPYFPIIPANVGSTDSPKIYVNMVYTGGESNDHSYNPSSHNFVEISNLGLTDLNLKGLYLHYTERGTNNWISLPLRGTVKSNGTFLIRGAQCSVKDINTTVIKVDSFDMEWTKSATYNNTTLEVTEDIGVGVAGHTIWDTKGLIKFSNSCAFFISAEETTNYFKTNLLNSSSPFTPTGVIKWYVDLVGLGSFNGINLPCEGAAVARVGSDILLTRYYSMDPATQATKSLSARKNTTDWTYINISNLNTALKASNYTPRASYENKTIFFDKTLLVEGAPNIINCSFGHNAHTTRTFNWVTVGYYDEFIQIRKESDSYTEVIGVDKFESFKPGSAGRTTKNWNNTIYDRIRSVTTDGTAFTVHKFIKDFVEPTAGTTQKYFYKAGRDYNWTEERSFILRNRADVITSGFNFLQHTDQQGFNKEEYETWRLVSEFISNDKSSNEYHFNLSTGDATQSGNRINEWIDYFNAGKEIFKNTEQMYVVGNNDLCPVDVFKLGVGDDLSKTNPININYFFTFEHPYTVPIGANGLYIPSLYSFVYGNTYFLAMNSEITELTRTDIFGDTSGVNIYSLIKTWCDNDLTSHSGDLNIKWRVAFTHEAPFTIITANGVMSYLVKDVNGVYQPQSSVERGGSHLNTVGNYWFSQFLQNNNFQLCLCGHKHTYSNSRYIREDPTKTMKPIVFEPLLDTAPWYSALPDREKLLVQVSANNTQKYVKYSMCQASGYKLTSNKELPAQKIPWLLEFYPAATQVENATTNTATVTPNPAQSFPHYIIWNVGTGIETEVPATTVALRDRIKGLSFKVKKTVLATAWAYKYNVPVLLTDLTKLGGNGSINPNNNIIVLNSL